jgi:hypothetical protein
MRLVLVAATALALLGCEQTPPPATPSSCGCNPPPVQPMYVQEQPPPKPGEPFKLDGR